MLVKSRFSLLHQAPCLTHVSLERPCSSQHLLRLVEVPVISSVPLLKVVAQFALYSLPLDCLFQSSDAKLSLLDLGCHSQVSRATRH